MPESSVVVDSSDEGDEYCYSVKIINPQKKSDYSLRRWRHVSKRFPSVESMQSQLIKDFGDVLPSRKEDIELGYIKPGHGAKGRTQWIFTEEDLDDMYKEHAEKTEIIIWLYRYQEKELTTKKRARSPTAQESTKKRKSSVVNTQKLLEVEEIVDKLKTKHEGKYTIEQINVWAHLIHMKKTQSYEEPPDKPFFRGKSKKAEDKKSTSSSSGVPDGISPSKRISLRTELLDQMEKLSNLYEKGVIDRAKYDNLQENILSDINKY